MKETERVVAGPGPGRGPFGGGMVGQKSMDFWPSAKRLLRRMGPDRVKALGVVLLAVVSVSLSVAGPRFLGKATDLVFAGVVGRQLPAGTTREQAAQYLRDSGRGTFADLVEHMPHLVPGVGVDFGAVAAVLLLVVVIYLRPPRQASCRDTCSTTSSRGPSAGCARTSRTRSTRCPCATSTSSRVASCSAGSPTTSTTSASRCSRR